MSSLLIFRPVTGNDEMALKKTGRIYESEREQGEVEEE